MNFLSCFPRSWKIVRHPLENPRAGLALYFAHVCASCQTPARRLHLPESECPGAPDAASSSATCHGRHFGLRWQAQRDTVFARAEITGWNGVIVCSKAPPPLPLCRRTPRRFARFDCAEERASAKDKAFKALAEALDADADVVKLMVGMDLEMLLATGYLPVSTNRTSSPLDDTAIVNDLSGLSGKRAAGNSLNPVVAGRP